MGPQALQRVSLPVPLGVLSCEVPGGDCPSQYHREVLHQELAAQRCLHGGKLLQGCGAGAGASLSSLLWLLWLQPFFPYPLTLQIPVMVYLDPVAVVAGGVPWWVILLAVLAGLLVLALLVLLMWKVRLGGGAGAGPRPGQAGGLWWWGSLTTHSPIYPANLH